MTDRPIIFSAPMIRALLDGRKTMTRRLAWRDIRDDIVTAKELERLEKKGWRAIDGADDSTTLAKPSPWQKVKPGDRLWVREAFRVAFGNVSVYKADLDRNSQLSYKPSIHMPRWASRLTLTVTATKIERLQDISEDDAIAEGVGRDSDGWIDYLYPSTQCCSTARDSFQTLWTSLHGENAWAENPEVVVISFETHRCNIDQMEAEHG